MLSHFVGQQIVYYQADGSYRTPETLACIDVDCHERGSFEGACDCVEWLVKNGFPNLFFSTSTNGRGIHAYVRIDKREVDAGGLDSGLLGLERWLRHQSSIHRWDLEGVEVKGRPPIFDWGRRRYELTSMRMGTLAKLPVEALDRPLELMNTTIKSVEELVRLGEESDQARGGQVEYSTTYSVPLRVNEFNSLLLEPIDSPVPESRKLSWPLWIERTASVGLEEPDSMGAVVFELSKWLLWVELFDEPDKLERTIELLKNYLITRHNGCVSRILQGNEREVVSHVERIVEGTLDLAEESDRLFQRLREGRRSGRYSRMIEIVPILLGDMAQDVPQSGATEEEYKSTSYSVPLSDEPLPPSIEKRIVEYARSRGMRLSDGEYPIVRFSRTFLGMLKDNGGAARISTESLTAIAANRRQQNDYKEALRRLGYLESWTGTYRAKVRSNLYRLTEEALRAYAEERSDVESPSTEHLAG